MADTGVTTFAGMATALRAAYPNLYSEKFYAFLNMADDLLPYLYDACVPIIEDTVTYPDGDSDKIPATVDLERLSVK